MTPHRRHPVPAGVRQSHRAAFSLTEVLIAVGIFGVAVAGILSLIPYAHVSERESMEDTRATLIASAVMEALPLSSESHLFKVATSMSNETPSWEEIGQRITTNISVTYDSACEPIRKCSHSEATNALNEARAVAVMTFSVRTNSGTPGVSTVEVAVSSPASAPEEQRTIRRFVRLVPVP